MTKKTHEAFAAVFAGTACIALSETGMDLNVLQKGIVFAASGIGCLLPDADDPRSWIGRNLPLICLPLWTVRGLVRLVAALTGDRHASDIADELGHRKLLHYPFTYIILFSVICMLLKLTAYQGAQFPMWLVCVITGMGIGIFSHIIGDAFFGGVAIFAPFVKTKIKFSPFRTGGVEEALAMLVLIICDIFVLRSAFML